MENQKVLENINLIKKKIREKSDKSIDTDLREKRNIEIIAISKRQPLEKLITALDCGHKIFGENQVQEALNKWPLLKKKYQNIELHLVGPLQSNKVKDAISIFDFIQTVNGQDEKGNCIVEYPKKIFCKYEKRNNKILVSNGSNLVIKKGKQYFRYSIKSTPFEFLLDKNFLINKIKNTSLGEVEDKYFFFHITEKNNNINVFFSKLSTTAINNIINIIYH